MKIAIDAMGGDYAPEAIIHGGVEAAKSGKGEYEVVFVGDESTISSILSRHFRIQEYPISIIHASQKIEMGESPTAALKKKPDASVVVAMELHTQGKVDAVVTAGHTGASMASAFFSLGRIKGVRRPAIGSLIPHGQGVTLLIDVGANLECKPTHLLQFGIMGDIYMKNVYHIAEPKVGLLNIGEEATKGREIHKEGNILLAESNLNFVGNVEGRDLGTDRADVVVADGFTGNVLLKTAEGTARVVARFVLDALATAEAPEISDASKVVLPYLLALRDKFDPEAYGGGHLVGTKGTVVISHGSSSRVAIANALALASEGAERDLVDRIEAGLSA